MSDKNKKQLDYSNISLWHSKGYSGKGINIWNIESLNTSHGKQTRQRILDAAPDCTVYSAAPLIHIDGNGNDISSKVTYDNISYSIEDFIKKFNIKIMSSSKENFFSRESLSTGKFWKKIIDKYDLCVFEASGNDRKEFKTFKDRIAWLVSSCDIDNNEIKFLAYSSYGEGIDFCDFTGNLKGTSFAAPFLAGKVALIKQRYPLLTKEEIYEYLKSNSLDLDLKGEDKKTGWGLVILPNDFDKDDEMVTKTKIIIKKNGIEKEVELNRILKDGTNYIRLRDFDDILELCNISYDEKRKMPIIEK